ncbi:hypothetical protein ACHAQH_009747 [Verticillium albo-atrum]
MNDDGEVEDTWVDARKLFSEWMLDQGKKNIATVVAPPMTGKSTCLGITALSLVPDDAVVVYALPNNMEQSVFTVCASSMGMTNVEEGPDETFDDSFSQASRHWVTSHSTLSREMTKDTFPTSAVILIDHVARCNIEYLTLWLRLRAWFEKGGSYQKVAILSTAKLPLWLFDTTEPFEIVHISMDRPLELGWNTINKPSFPQREVQTPNEIVAAIHKKLEHFFKMKSKQGSFPVALFYAKLSDVKRLLPRNMSRPAIRLIDSTLKYFDCSPISPAREHTFLVIPPGTQLSLDFAKALKLSCVTHVFVLGHGERGNRYDKDLGTVVHDRRLVLATDEEMERVGFYLSSDPETNLRKLSVYAPRMAELPLRLQENGSIDKEFANGDMYASVFAIIEGRHWHGLSKVTVNYALSSGCGGIPRPIFDEIARRLRVMNLVELSDHEWKMPKGHATQVASLLPNVNYNVSVAHLLAAADALKDAHLKQLLIYIAVIMTETSKCRDAITIINKAEACKCVSEYSAPAVYRLTSQGFLWSMLGLWLAAITEEADRWQPSAHITVNRALLQELDVVLDRYIGLMGGKAISISDAPRSNLISQIIKQPNKQPIFL